MVNSTINPTIDPQTLIKEAKQLVSLPTVCIQINKMVDDKSCSATDIGEVISHDVNLSARLLRIANSSFYAFPSEIETISRAVTIIGDTELRALVLATAAIDSFKRFPLDEASMNNFWKHSLQCGIVSRLIASKIMNSKCEQLFVAGLLHDIGHLLLFQKYPELEKNILVNVALNNTETHIEETNVLGFDHAYLGGELLKEWGLPASLVEPVKFHHMPFSATEHKMQSAIVHIANIIAKNTQLEHYKLPFDQLNFDKGTCDLINFSEEVFEFVMEEFSIQYSNAVNIFIPKTKVA